MRDFAYTRVEAVAEATAQSANGAVLLAGGTELLNWLRLGIVDTDQVADISRVDELRGIVRLGETLRVGALTTLNEIGDSSLVQQDAPVLSQACLKAASAQLRNLATIGGNVLQKTRCPYFRADAPGSKTMPWPCNKRVADSGCAARESGYARLALFGATELCVATHPSDPAVALAVLDARIEIIGRAQSRTLAMSDFLLSQQDARRLAAGRAGNEAVLENRLEPGDVIVAFHIPLDAAARSSAYLKVRERASYEYAMVSAAVAVELDVAQVRAVRIALGSVAQKPWRLTRAERALVGMRLETTAINDALDAALAEASPPQGNAFKVRLARTAVHRTLMTAAGLA